MSLRKQGPDETCAPPQTEGTSPGQRNQEGSWRGHSPPLGAARKVDTERVGVDGRPSADPLAGHRKISAIERQLLAAVRSKKAVVNVKNKDDNCLRWSLRSALFPACDHVDRSSKYPTNDNLNFKGIDAPTPISQIPGHQCIWLG